MKQENKEFRSDIDLDSEDITMEKVQFAYDNGVGYLKEIDEGNRIITNRTTLLLGYMSVIIGFLGAVITCFLNDASQFTIFGTVFPIALFIGFCTIAIYVSFTILSPNPTHRIHNIPKHLLRKEVFSYDLTKIKFFETELIQGAIDANLKRQLHRGRNLSRAIKGFFIVPIVVVVLSTILHFIF